MAFIKVCKNCGEENEPNLEKCKKCEFTLMDRKHFEFKEKNNNKEIKDNQKGIEYRQCNVCRSYKLYC